MNETYSASIHRIIPKRTDGDGMEKEEKTNEPSNLKVEQIIGLVQRQSLSDQLIYRPVELNKCLVSPTPIIGKVFSLVPKNKLERTKPLNFSKEPKFIPYEPYKAAVRPIIPIKNEKSKRKNIIVLKSHDVSNVQLSTKNNVVKNGSSNISILNDDIPRNTEKSDIAWKIEKKMLEEKISQLKIENSELDSQVKFQAQVNGELKKLLVAAVGEDVETRVQLLTEDKLHLTKQLLKTVKSLSTHQEQIEWLAGQCEVWRSKFLASSMLIEDLAKWKAALTQKLSDFRYAVKSLLDEKGELRLHLIPTLQNLIAINENIGGLDENSSNFDLSAYNIVQVCESSHRITDILITKLLNRNPMDIHMDSAIPESLTNAEKIAEQLLMQPLVNLEKTDMACNAVMIGASLALSASSPHCSHCNGEVFTI